MGQPWAQARVDWRNVTHKVSVRSTHKGEFHQAKGNVVAKVDSRGKIGKGASTGTPTKVVPGAEEEMLLPERGVERTETVAAARFGGALQLEDWCCGSLGGIS